MMCSFSSSSLPPRRLSHSRGELASSGMSSQSHAKLSIFTAATQASTKMKLYYFRLQPASQAGRQAVIQYGLWYVATGAREEPISVYLNMMMMLNTPAAEAPAKYRTNGQNEAPLVSLTNWLAGRPACSLPKWLTELLMNGTNLYLRTNSPLISSSSTVSSPQVEDCLLFSGSIFR